MKKTVILILVLLPIVLVITIAFAGKILSLYHHIPVEKVEFVNEVGDELDDSYTFIVNVGETKATSIRIFPEMASNQLVTYSSQDESICTVDTLGNITGVSVGSATVRVETQESAKADILTVLVVADSVTGVTLPSSYLTLTAGEMSTLVPTVEPYTAINKNVTFESSNPAVVSVRPSGLLNAHTAGTAVITVTTQDGGFTATCTVAVVDGTPPLVFDMTDATDVAANDTGYILSNGTIDLAPYLRYNETNVDPSSIRWRLASGQNVATLTDTTVAFTKTGTVLVTVYVGDAEMPSYQTQIRLFYHKQ